MRKEFSSQDITLKFKPTAADMLLNPPNKLSCPTVKTSVQHVERATIDFTEELSLPLE
jgi:hypothetical protein